MTGPILTLSLHHSGEEVTNECRATSSYLNRPIRTEAEVWESVRKYQPLSDDRGNLKDMVA